LPDFAEEYSIHVRSGVGAADVDFTLEDGWNLTAFNQKLDSQTDENVEAVASLVKSIGGAVAKAADATDPDQTVSPAEYQWYVQASNVPLGYYEAIVGKNDNCQKQLMGWRYVGFAPFNSCPTKMCGQTSAHCSSGEGPIYGLVFERGVMTFRSLDPAGTNLDRIAEPVGITEKESAEFPEPELRER
jgi:hypothetical protein